MLEVAVNLGPRLLLEYYPYGAVTQRWKESCTRERPRQPLPSSTFSVRDWIDRSRLPYKHALLELVDEKLGVTEAEADVVLASDECREA